eukprot:s3090_g6.t1
MISNKSKQNKTNSCSMLQLLQSEVVAALKTDPMVFVEPIGWRGASNWTPAPIRHCCGCPLLSRTAGQPKSKQVLLAYKTEPILSQVLSNTPWHHWDVGTS